MERKKNNTPSSPTIFLGQTCSLPTLLSVDPDHLNFSLSKSSMETGRHHFAIWLSSQTYREQRICYMCLCHSHVHITEERHDGSTENLTQTVRVACFVAITLAWLRRGRKHPSSHPWNCSQTRQPQMPGHPKGSRWVWKKGGKWLDMRLKVLICPIGSSHLHCSLHPALWSSVTSCELD